MRLPVLTFDIETQTDLKSGAHLFGLDLPEADLDQALTKLRRQDSGSDFQRYRCMKLSVFPVYGWMNRV